MTRYDLRAMFGDIGTVSRWDSLRVRLEILDRELPVLASLVAEVACWRAVLDAEVPRSACPLFLIYRDALLEYNSVQAELVSIGYWLVA